MCKGLQVCTKNYVTSIEKRPSLLVGDFVYARAPGDEHHFEGYVHRVEREHVSLCFHDGFHARHIKGTQYEIQYYLLLDLSTGFHSIEHLLKECIMQ